MSPSGCSKLQAERRSIQVSRLERCVRSILRRRKGDDLRDLLCMDRVHLDRVVVKQRDSVLPIDDCPRKVTVSEGLDARVAKMPN